MDRAEQLQLKVSVYTQLSVIVTYTIMDIFFSIDIYLKGEVSSPFFLFIFFNVLLIFSFYIFIKKHRVAGSHLFFTVLALVLFANAFFNKYEYVNIQTIYIIPIFLTLIVFDRKFTILYSIIIFLIFLLEQIIHNQINCCSFIIIIMTVILSIVLLVLYEIWIKEINNLRIESLHSHYTSNLKILGQVAELKDEETHEHLERVSIIVELIADKLKRNPRYSHYLSDFYIKDIKAASALHDIGKIGVPDKILQKNGKLTTEEFSEVKKHTTYGAKLIIDAQLKTNSNFYDLAIDLAKHHHEKWDGTGYPDNLKGEDIPLSARIMSIADVYDALVSKRSYKRAYSEREAFAIIVSESGRQFDPEIVSCFMKIHKKIYESIESLL